MARRRRVAQVRPDQPIKGRQFTAEVILWAVRWYLMFPISYRDLELMLADRGVDVDPLRELPCRPAVHGRARGRTDGSIRLRVTAILMSPLPGRGRPQRVHGSAERTR